MNCPVEILPSMTGQVAEHLRSLELQDLRVPEDVSSKSRLALACVHKISLCNT